MLVEDPNNRKWERHACMVPCQVIPLAQSDTVIRARIINIGQGGILMEADFAFNPDDQITITPLPDRDDLEHFDCPSHIRGTVRWGQQDSASLMGLYYVGVEFEELLPLKEALVGHI